MLDAWYDYNKVGCIKVINGNIDRTSCFDNGTDDELADT